MDRSTFSKIDEFIGTGNYLLNACLSGSLFGGIPNNRSVCFAGPSGTGKTFLGIGAGIQQITKKHYDKILIGRPVIFNGENLGALPGSEEEKLKPSLII